MRFVRRILTALTTGYVIYFLSETIFWGRFNPETPRSEFVISWIAYSILTLILLTVISRFRVRSIWALFLAGAVYGWSSEGILVQTMYDSFPLQISFTGLAWHSLLAVCCGWYLLRSALAFGPPRRLVFVCFGLGLFWGLWSVCWWIENGTRTPFEEYTRYAFVSGTLLVIALWLENLFQPKEFKSSAWEAWLLFALAASWYSITAIAAPVTLFILPPLMGLVFFALRKNRRQEVRPDILYELKVSVPWYRYLAVFLVPLTAVSVYGLMWIVGQGLPTNWVVYLVTTPAGFIMLGLSLYKVLTNRRPTSVEQSLPGYVATN